MATNGSFAQQDQYKNEAYPATGAPTSADEQDNPKLTKDEIGWYFVEQYYTTLSKNPEKLHLFYGKRSQFVSGLEAEVAPVSVGRAAIQERIRDLDFQDCKVRISNVDSQASLDTIVIQVIGETSNKSADLKKFVQTFVLAKQPTGYFVLNDIFRYISEEGEEEPENLGQTEGPLVDDVEMPKAQGATDEAIDVEEVDHKLESVKAEEPVAEEEAPATNGTAEDSVEPEEERKEEAAGPKPKAEELLPTPEAAEKDVEEETVKEPEKPAEPTPSPTPAPAKAATPEKPAAPPKPITWASRAAAAAGPVKPAVPKSAATPPAQAKAAPTATPSKPAQIQPTPSATAPSDNDKENAPPTPGTPGGWQSVGNDHAKRQNRPQSISGPLEKDGTMGYVRNVTEKVSEAALREALSSHGKLIYFDINRSKNCAFVEYEDAEGYQAAQAANPHKVSGESIYVEARRPKNGAYGGSSYNGPRGGINNRGRGGFEQGRPGNQGGRGNFGQQTRGRGGGATRGRGVSTTAA
ncbi:hypothetical protein BJ878DRAFT_246949 [Calycina marina]|uniref:Uncharacterized protein n=1 Tax=Calycina marina TaxID=1763456 RepID=A0A9P8CBQ1_9HELO|nr:hypothetical protein BJ878DRAFT_246949 [Calycina marina]